MRKSWMLVLLLAVALAAFSCGSKSEQQKTRNDTAQQGSTSSRNETQAGDQTKPAQPAATTPSQTPATTPSETPATPRMQGPATPPPAPEAKMAKTASGLQYADFKVGTGATPTPGSVVSVHYTGWLQNGQKFDSSLDRGQAFSFPLGQGRVIKGWDEGVASMRVGGKRRLVIPSQLAYGERGFPGAIPPNATLTFDVELLGVK